jgi:ribonuclease HII
MNLLESNTIENNLLNLWEKTRTKNVIKRSKIKEIPLIDEKTGKKIRKKQQPLKHRFHYNEELPEHSNNFIIEAGIDEAGRGPLFGRVYTACVILPSNNFDHSKIKDSKKFTSKKKLMEVYNYIIDNALAYSVCYETEETIDSINIRQATLKSMNRCIENIKKKLEPQYLLVDGCDFYTKENIPYICIEGGDNLYTPIAAASILAKVERDIYIEELCKENPYLDEYYGLSKNKGYGTKLHIDGIKNHGISLWHRKTFGICKNY